MDAIGYFFGEIFTRLSAQLRYKASDAVETKLRETMDKPFNRNTSANQQKASDSQD
jgi:ABC-type transport system involved in cytochrome bd biosynthesis fused ATPase/permease subunit